MSESSVKVNTQSSQVATLKRLKVKGLTFAYVKRHMMTSRTLCTSAFGRRVFCAGEEV